MPDKVFNVLFLCTGNTARSILAESILRKAGTGKFRSFSAGSQPKGTVNPFALKVLTAHQYPTDGLHSKSWEEYSGPNAPVIDIIITVCDSAAGEACPLWPGRPLTAHWGIEDPASVDGTEFDKERAFEQSFRYLSCRIDAFIALPVSSLDATSLQSEMHRIGLIEGATNKTSEP